MFDFFEIPVVTVDRLTAPGMRAFDKIVAWLDNGGHANKTIPFDFIYMRPEQCVGGALRFLLGSHRDLHTVGMSVGMTENEVTSLFYFTPVSELTPSQLGNAIKDWLGGVPMRQAVLSQREEVLAA